MELVLNQFFTFLIMFVFGITLGAVYNIYRNIAVKIKNKTILNFMDILLGILGGIAAFSVLVYANRGDFRFYVILAVILGISCYFQMFKKLYPGK